jgi:hypothetical protein
MDLNPQALSEILLKNAKDLTDPEIDQLIAGLRAERASYLSAEAAGKRAKASPLSDAERKARGAALTLESLGLMKKA